MRTDDFRPSDNVEDDREASASRSMPGGKGGLGIGAVIIIGLISWYFGVDPSVLLNGAHIYWAVDQLHSKPAKLRRSPPVRRAIRLVSSSPWCSAVRRTCGRRFSQQAGGPITHLSCAYSPAQNRRPAPSHNRPWGRSIVRAISAFTSIPPSLKTCRGSSALAQIAMPAKFSEAYVIAHEVGHHVQDELGILPRVMQAQQASSSKVEANQLQVRVELQADCLAGIWANRAQQKYKFLDPGDVDQALQTASAIGDDRLQKETQGYVVPDAFTHGPSEQRKRWFMNVFNSQPDLRLQYAIGKYLVICVA